MEVTAIDDPMRRLHVGAHAQGLGVAEPLQVPARRQRVSVVDRPDQLLNPAQGTLVVGATPDESPPG
jgi:hypothetical protein